MAAKPEPKSTDVVIVLTTHPREGAEDLARTLVERHLAACVQVVPGVRSWYRWKGSLEASEEVRLEIKTGSESLPGLEEALAELHPYEVPELLVVPVIGGSPAYLSWVREQAHEA
jgi:periplasmic divalent cation tolerance protein